MQTKAAHSPSPTELTSEQKRLLELKDTVTRFISEYQQINAAHLTQDERLVLNSLNDAAKVIATPTKFAKTDIVREYDNTTRNLKAIRNRPVKVVVSKGWFSSEEKEVTLPIHRAIDDLLISLNAQLEEIKVTERQQAIPAVEVNARIDAAIKTTAEKAYERGATDVIQRLADILNRNPDARLALENAEGGSQVLALVGYEGQEKAQQSGRTSPPSTQPPVKTETQEVKKCKDWIGVDKFSIIEPLVELFEKKDTSQTEKQLIQFLIFQLMLHSKDKTVKTILAEVGTFFVKEAKLIPDKHPALMAILSKHAEREDEVSSTPLAKEDYQVFAQLVSPKSALFIPKDEQALKVFGSHFATMNGKDVPLVTKKEYKEHFLKTLSQEVQKAPAAPAAGVHFWPGNNPVQPVGAASVISGILSQQEGLRK